MGPDKCRERLLTIIRSSLTMFSLFRNIVDNRCGSFLSELVGLMFMFNGIQTWFAHLVAMVILCSFSSSAVSQQINGVAANQAPSFQRSQAAHNQSQFFNNSQSRGTSGSEIIYSNQAGQSGSRVGYRLDSGDVLGVFLEGVLGKSGEAPPVFYPPAGSSLGPSMGFPVVVRENGTINLPLVDPIPVRGLTVSQAEERVKAIYFGNNKTGKKILNDTSMVLVSLQRKRTINVIVIREDNSTSTGNGQALQRGAVNSRSDRSGRSTTLHLPAGDNDLLHALMETGGLPGLNAKPEARIYRSRTKTNSRFDQGGFPRSNSGFGGSARYDASGKLIDNSQPSHSTYKVPLQQYRYGSRGEQLTEGDIVVVESKPTEVYYTSGLLRGGEHPFPRDRSLNVLEAIAIAGGTTVSSGGRFGLSQLPPTELNVIRNNPRYGQANIRVDLNRALYDPSQRIQVVPGDHLILRYKTAERIGNFGINGLNTYGLRRVFQ